MKSPTSKYSVINEKKIESINDLLSLMIELRDIRREMVKNVNQNLGIDVSHLNSFQNVQKSLKNCLQNDYECDLIVDSTQLKFNIKDEYLSVEKDLIFLDVFINHNQDYAELIRRLAKYHPSGVDEFMLETEKLTNLLKNGTKNEKYLDYFITDWDGTFKTYCSNYSTCMQPVYSGVILTKFLNNFAKFSAVLTAGPLRNPGILDLTSIPSNYINFGGSWGREWSLTSDLIEANSTTVVENSCFTQANKVLFEKMTSELENLLKTKEFAQFKLVGSGFQRKVDRLTIGVQNVTGDVPKEDADKLLKELSAILGRLDPLGDVFHLDKSSLDVEIAIKNKRNKAPWSKGDGLAFIVGRLNLNLDENSRAVVCGDTVGDLGMVEYFTSRNVNVSTVFVNPNEEVEEKLKGLMSKSSSNLCIVGCPEVIHAAMMNTLKNAGNAI